MSQQAMKATIWLVLLCLFVSTLPIPTYVPKSYPQVPYPCENCPCGCSGPEKCWTSCCCMTPAERLDWAKKKGITPPAYALLAETQLVKPLYASAVSKGCTKCSKCSAQNAQPKRQTTATKQAKLILGIAAAKCSGKSFDLSSLPHFTIPNLPIFFVTIRRTFLRLNVAEYVPTGPSLDVPTPPPRLPLAV